MGKSTSSRALAICGILTGIAVLLLFLASVAPTGRLALVAAASFAVAAVVLALSPRHALMVYLAASLLGLLLISDKLPVLGFAVMLGNYPVVKLYIERIRNLVAEWCVKLVACNVYFAVLMVLWKLLFAAQIALPLPWWVLALLFNAAFVVYDLAFSVMVSELGRRFFRFFG